MDGLVLADDLFLELCFEVCQLGVLGLLDFHRRDPRPQLNDLGHIVHGHPDLTGSGLLGGQLAFQLGNAGLALGHLLIVDGLIDIGVGQIGFFLLEGIQLFPGLQILGDDRVGQIAAGAGLVQQIDGLIGEVG